MEGKTYPLLALAWKRSTQERKRSLFLKSVPLGELIVELTLF
jgi:hypothetical protein